MNSLMQQQENLFAMTQALRTQLIDALSDDDLAFTLPGSNPSLGALCRENGQVQRSYLDSFKTFKQDFHYADVDPALATSAEKLRAWFAQLDTEMVETLKALDEDTVQGQIIDRTHMQVPVGVQFHLFRESMLIFYGKAAVYLKAMDRPLPGDIALWIG